MVNRMGVGALTVAAAVSLVACGASADPPSVSSGAVSVTGHRLLDADEFAATIGQSNTLTIDVHVPYEGDIPGTDLSIPFDRIAENSDRLPAGRAATIAVYCRSGPMSTTAAETLKSLGYTDVVELDGGMKAWRASGRPLVGT
ncbi:rhodanese-like domain-containing protein [Mycolicibacterium porcinum]|uniref:rhodanese-like domain-containing protein n=1 Tax=Mycolicibacterium porcinum TaxID=39693 RepID=UPI00084919F6|nr:rhodanese-like domain-containing protein [Mycolicibacterium porcinum]ODR17177.1 sulfurtransferase [Mycolicibacterium porcinum]